MFVVLLTAWLAWVGEAQAWTADQPWRTVETAHYRVHYPLDSEAWALDLAARADAIRERVARVVGYAPDRKVDLVLMDPAASANGFAVPLWRAPLMGVFPTAPSPASGIGHYRLWAEDLVLHEDVHLVHMLRPARNPWQRIVGEGLLGIRPLARAPAWVIEGYATLVEGELTGAGRPNSDSRAAWLRTLARHGQLPTYPELDGSGRWRSGSMRYLVGSAYLEWLQARSGRESLPSLWLRMTAREARRFEEAFEGVFGDDPATLYGRFAAELTAGALALERPASEDPVLFVDLEGTAGPPAVSPSGDRVALVISDRDPPELVVLATAIDEDALKERQDARDDLLIRDPEDVPAVEAKAAPHKEIARRKHRGSVPQAPRWIDAQTLLYSLWRPDSRGNLVPDLYTWDPETGRERRLTRGANLREASPCGGTAVAVHREDGVSHLVTVDLATGGVQDRTAPSAVRVDAGPRQDDACTVLAWLENQGEWVVVVDHDGEVQRLAHPSAAQPLAVDVRPDGSGVVVALGLHGFVDLWEWRLEDAVWVRRSRGNGGVRFPEVSPDGQVYALREAPDGHDLVSLSGSASLGDAPAPGVILADLGWTRGAERPPPVDDVPALPEGTAPTPRAYRLGRQRVRLAGGSQLLLGPTREIEVGAGAVVTDRVGRSELVLLSGWLRDETVGIPALSGVRAAWTLRPLRVHPRLEAWWLDEDTPVAGGGGALRWAHAGRAAMAVEAGALAESLGRWAANLEVVAKPSTVVGRVGLEADARLRAQVGSPQLVWGHAGGRASLGGLSLGLGADLGQSWGGPWVVGGLQRGLDTDLRTRHHLWMPGLGERQTADRVQALQTELRTLGDVVGLSAQRVVLDPRPGAAAATATPSTLLQLDARGDVAAQPLFQLPALALSAGVACRIETPTGLDLARCQDRSSWSGWLSLRTVPGRAPGLP